MQQQMLVAWLLTNTLFHRLLPGPLCAGTYKALVEVTTVEPDGTGMCSLPSMLSRQFAASVAMQNAWCPLRHACNPFPILTEPRIDNQTTLHLHSSFVQSRSRASCARRA